MIYRIIFLSISLLTVNLIYGQVNLAVKTGINYTFSSAKDGDSVWNPDLGYQVGSDIEIQVKKISYVFGPNVINNAINTRFLEQENKINLFYFSLPFSIQYAVYEKFKIGIGIEKKLLIMQLGPDPDIPLMSNDFKDLDQGIRVEIDYFLLENFAINISGFVGLQYNGEQTDNFNPLLTGRLKSIKTHRLNSIILNLKYFLVNK